MSLAFVRSAIAFTRPDAIYANGQEMSKLNTSVGCGIVEMDLCTSFHLNFLKIWIWKASQKYMLTHIQIVGTIR